MKASKTLLMFFTVLILGGYIWFVERNRLSPAEQKAVDRQAFDLSMDRVDRIGIRTPSWEVEMVFVDKRWMLSEPKGARASLPVVNQLLARFRSLSRGEFITPADMRTRSLTLADFGLEVPQIILTLGVEDNRRVYSVGSPNPLGTALYVKEESSQNVMLVSSDLLEILPPNVSFFRDSELFPVAPSEVRELALVSNGETLRLQREGGGWRILNPVRAEADSGKVEDLLTKLGMSRIEGVVNRPGPDELAAFAQEGAVRSLRLWPNTQTVPIEVEVGGTVPGNPERCYARITGQEGLVEVSKGLQVLAQTPAVALRNRNVLSMPPETIRSLRISGAEEEIVLVKTGQEWRLQEPFDLPASGARVQQVLAQWNESMVEAFVPGQDLNESAEPLHKVTFVGEQGTAPLSYSLYDHSPQPGRALVQKAGAEEILQIVPDVVRFLPMDPLDYVSRQMLSFDPGRAVRLTLEQGGVTTTVVRNDAASPWTARGEGVVVDPAALQQVLAGLSSLYADSVLSFQPELLAESDTRLSIGLGGETPGNITLVISGSMAWVQGREVGYTLGESRLTELLRSIPRAVVNAEGSSHGTEETP